MRADRSARRRGFTLMELVIALGIGAMVVLGARVLMDGLSDHTRATLRAARDSDSRGNIDRAARQLFANVALAPGLQPTFVGTPSDARFGSACPSARGGFEPCQVRLLLRPAGDATDAVLALSTGAELTLGHSSDVRLRYLADAAEGGRWSGVWNDPLAAPLAVEVRIGSDSRFYRIGERR